MYSGIGLYKRIIDDKRNQKDVPNGGKDGEARYADKVPDTRRNFRLLLSSWNI
jgi:hypothetical protein